MAQKNWWDEDAAASSAQSSGSNWWDEDSVGGTGKQEGDGAFMRGLKSAKQSADITTKLVTGDASGTAQAVRDAELYRRANPGTKEGDELAQAWEAGEGPIGGIASVGRKMAKDWREADGVVSGIRATGRNLNAMREGIVSQLGNSVAPIAGLAAGGALGTAAGSAVPFVGNVVGGAGGAWLGASAGNTLVEGGGQLLEALL